MDRRKFTLIELMVVVAIIVVLAGMLVPVLSKSRENARRVNCAGNLKCIGLALLMYSGDNGGFFLVEPTVGAADFEPLNVQDVLDDGKVYACPSASQSLTLASNTNYRYRGSGLTDDNEFATATTLAYDASGNHPDNQWMNALFIDGHAEGAKPDGRKLPNGWNINN